MHKKHSEFTLNLTSQEAAYIAGIIDGEGCIQFTKYANKARYRTCKYTIQVSVTNTNPDLIDWLESRLGGYRYEVKRKYGARKRSVNKYWHLTWSTLHAANILSMISPYLVCKLEQAQIAKEFQDHIEETKHRGYVRRGLEKGRPVLSDEDITYRESMFQKMKLAKRSHYVPLLESANSVADALPVDHV